MNEKNYGRFDFKIFKHICSKSSANCQTVGHRSQLQKGISQNCAMNKRLKAAR